MWYNGSGDMNTNSSMNMNFNAANHNVFDFSLHSSNMQQATETSSATLSVSILFVTTDTQITL